MSGRPQSIVIVGRDAALWLTATALIEALRPIGVTVTAVELPSHLNGASIYATLPPLESLHSKLGVDEGEMLRLTGGSFSLGWNVVRPNVPPFLLAHGSYGAPIAYRDFFSCWQKATRFGLAVPLENFSPTAMAARNGRVLLPDESTAAFGRSDYAYHLPAIAYCSMLKGRAHQLGVTICHTLRLGIERHDAGGAIRGVLPEGGSFIAGDLFIDASGPDAELIGRGLGIATETWKDYFPFDRVLRARGAPYSLVPVYAELRLGETSWSALHGTQGATHLVHAFADDELGDQAAIANAASASSLVLSEISLSDSAPAVRTDAWARNCVAIGGSACTFDPLLDLELHAIQLGIVHLTSLFPAAADAATERVEFNRTMRSHFDRLRDVQSALYWLSGAATKTPPTVQQKLDAFLARGAVALMEDETLSVDQWRALFVGLGLRPESWPPSIDSTPAEEMKEGFRQILAFVHDKVLEQPTHNDYLATIGATSR